MLIVIEVGIEWLYVCTAGAGAVLRRDDEQRAASKDFIWSLPYVAHADISRLP